MKKSYITPAMELEVMAAAAMIALSFTGEEGTGKLNDENAEGDALVKEIW